MTSSPLWQIELVTEPRLMDPFIEYMELEALSLSWYINEETGQIHVLGNYEGESEATSVESKLDILVRAHQDTVTTYKKSLLPEVNWVEEYAKMAPAVTIGPFYIYGSHLKEAPFPSGKVPLWIDAATAFGTGEHHTTKGCLLALAELSKGFFPQRVLDMGCGTGILGIAAAKLWPCPVFAGDIDPEAVKTTQLNAKRNHVIMPTFLCRGFESSVIKEQGPFDLIIANILAKPLCSMANDMARNLVSGGLVILSGLLASQARMVLSAYINLGFKKISAQTHHGWSTLVLCHDKQKRDINA